MANETIYPYGQGGQAASGLAIVNDLTTGGADKALSAAQGKVLGDRTSMPLDKIVPSISGTIRPNNGSEWDVSGYWRTPYTRIDPTKPVLAKGDSKNSSVAFVAFYNDDLTFISAVSNVGDAGIEYEIQVPTGATIARVTCTTAQKDTAYLRQETQQVNEVSASNRGILSQALNLIDGVRVSVGYLVDGIQIGATYYTTDFIRISDALPLELEVLAGFYGVSCEVLSFYSEMSDASYLGGVANAGQNTTFKCKKILTIPANAKYVRLCAKDEATLRSYKLTCSVIDYSRLIADVIPDVVHQSPAEFLLPKYMDVAVGRQCDFWVDDYISNPAGLPFRYNTPSGVSRFDDGHLRITPSGTGDLDLVLKTFYRDDPQKISTRPNEYLVGTRTIKIRKVASSGGGNVTKNVLIVGDSLVEKPNPNYCLNPRETYDLLAEDGDVTINQIGTQTYTTGGKTYRHEGHSGWTWGNFCNSGSPFYYNGGIDFQAYMSANFSSLSGIDYCIVMLGTNDTASTVPALVKTFLDALIRDYPNCKIAIGIPAMGPKHAGVPTEFADKIRYLATEYLKYDNGQKEGYENVTCIGQGCWIDRVNDYPHTDGNATPYNSTDKIVVYTDTLHPLDQGYKQWGRAVYCKIRSWIAGNL